MTPPVLSAAGFHGSLRQPEQALRLRLKPCPDTIDWTALDDWLSNKLRLALQSSTQAMDLSKEQSPASKVNALCWRIMQLAAELQRAAFIPVLEPGRILATQADTVHPDSWLVDICVARIDYVPEQKTRLVYDAATVLILAVAAAPAGFAVVEPLYQQLELKVLQPLRSVMPVGKSALPLLACAYERGTPWRHLGAGMFQLGWGARSIRMQNSKIDADSALGVGVAQNKWVSAEWMRRAGLPAPQNILATNEKEALAAQAALGWPLVIKPAALDRGEGVVVDITSESALLSAFRQTAKLSSQTLVERQAQGVCHRLLVVRGKVVYTVKRLPIAVCGDGQQTIDELIHAANNDQLAIPSWARAPMYPCDDHTQTYLQQADLSLSSVLAAGVWAKLRPIESTNWGGQDEDYTTNLHPDNADIACRAAALFGLDVAGVDIISADITRPWHENGAIINEVNSSPVLGQSDSSRKALPEVLSRLLPERGRICIEAYVGADQAMALARAQQAAWRKKGVAGYVTSHNVTVAASGVETHMAQDGLFSRCLALLMDKSVEALALVIQTDELLHNGLPVDAVTCLTSTDEALTSYYQATADQGARSDAVLAFLRRLCAK